MLRALLRPRVAPAAAESVPTAVPDLRALLDAHHAEVWRIARRLGVPEAAADDVAQQVFVVAAAKHESIEPGREHAFLIRATVRLAANARRSAVSRHEHSDDELDRRASEAPQAEELLDEKRLRVLLDEVLDSLPEDLRTVLVLFELEELRLDEIAQLLDVPRGTAASRL